MRKGTTIDHNLATQQLTRWFGKKMLRERDIKVVDLEVPGATGFSSDTLMFNLKWKEDGKNNCKKLVARLKPTGDCNVFPSYDISLQFNVMRILSQTDVPVPRMLFFEEDTSVLGVEFYVMEFVDGRTPADNPPYNMEGWLLTLSPSQCADLWWNGLENMASIHRLDWKELGFDFLDQAKPGQSHIEQHLAYYDDFFAWGMKGQEHPVCASALAWLHENRPGEYEPVSLCWGDARIGNMIFDNQTCVAVVDWEMACVGNPEEDLAWWIWMDSCYSEGLDVPRLEGFPGRDETIGRWQELTGFQVRHMAYYEIYAAFRYTLILGRVGLAMKHQGILPENSDFVTNNFASNLLEKMLCDVM